MKIKNPVMKLLVLLVASTLLAMNAYGHQVLGRPAYNLNEDSNTPPSMEVETQVGDYSINFMVYPAFPKAGERGRLNLYASTIDSGESFKGTVHFKVRSDSWFADDEEALGSQQADDFVFRQGFEFSEDGNYIVTAEFEANGEPYIIDVPLRVGAPKSIGPLGIAIAVILLSLIGVSLLQRRKKLGSRVRKAKEEDTL